LLRHPVATLIGTLHIDVDVAHLLIAHLQGFAVESGKPKKLAVEACFSERGKSSVVVQVEGTALTPDIGGSFCFEDGYGDIGADEKTSEGAASRASTDDGYLERRGRGRGFGRGHDSIRNFMLA
jgi:hypothetical protein